MSGREATFRQDEGPSQLRGWFNATDTVRRDRGVGVGGVPGVIMTFRLSDRELTDAYEAIGHHGYSALFPVPPEWAAVKDNWPRIKAHLLEIDLDTYKPHKPLRTFAPKSRANIRVVHLLHPEDLIIYTALVLIVKDDLEAARLPKRARRVFSYRADARVSNRLYSMRGAYANYKAQLVAKTAKGTVKYVSVADIADFYPRIYQHRLENIIMSTAGGQRGRDVARVLVKKLILALMENNSYGIPVGPYASRILGEAILIDVDAFLRSRDVDFVRWVDDYHIFSRSEYAAQSAVFELAERLFVSHGLTLQTAKTRIWPVGRYRDAVVAKPEDKLTKRDAVISLLGGVGYGEGEVDEEEVQELLGELQGLDLLGMLTASVSDQEIVDYQVVRYVLKQMPKIPGVDDDFKLRILGIVLDNAELLYPVVDHVAEYVLSFGDFLPAEKKRVGRKLFKALDNTRNPPPEYYAMWILYIFSTSPGWIPASKLARLYEQSTSAVVKRYAALAISTCGTRAEALAIREDLPSASGWLRLAIVAASRKLGDDERKYWRRANPSGDVVEQLL